MAWVAAVGTLASAAAGSSASRRAADTQRQQIAFQQQGLDWEKKLYEDEKRTYGPLKAQMLELASSDGPLFWGDTKDQIDKNYEQGFLQAEDNARRTGTLGSDLKQNWDTTAILKKASDLSKAWLQGKKDKNALALSILGRDQSSMLGTRVGDAFTSGSRMFGDMSNQWAGAAQNAWAGASQGAASTAELYSKNKGWT